MNAKASTKLRSSAVRLGQSRYPSGVGRLYAEDLIVKIEGAAGTMIVSG